MHPFKAARQNMINGQLRPNGVGDACVLAAVEAVPREMFVPGYLQGMAYADEDIAIGGGRYLPDPTVLARLVQAAGVTAADIVLDIGPGTGYSTAILGQLANTVVAVESDAALIKKADQNLRELDICNAAVVEHKSMKEGYAAQAPFDVILINGSVPAVPELLMSQLSDGGRLVAVISNRGHMGSAVLIIRKGDSFSRRVLFDAAAPALPGFGLPASFVF
jgi:protein-L-isoaspartate(D-aspartate) O-methyltransferase